MVRPVVGVYFGVGEVVVIPTSVVLFMFQGAQGNLSQGNNMKSVFTDEFIFDQGQSQ